MSRWRSAAWAGMGAAAMALGLYGAGAIRHSDAVQTASAEDADAPTDKNAAPAKNEPVTDPAALARLGVKTAAVTTTVASQMTDGFARGLDVGPLAAIVAEADAARAAAAASQAEASRLEALYRQDVSASRRSVEAARALALADAAIQMGFHISFSGVLTFKTAEELRNVARSVPTERLLIETDCPFLAPIPYRGKRNEPAFVVETAKKLAELKQTSVEEIARVTSNNFRRLFSL